MIVARRAVLVASCGLVGLAGLACGAPPSASAPSSAPPGTQGDVDCFPAMNAPIEQLKLTRVDLGAQPRAIVALPDGTSFTLKVGTAVGRDFGVVHEIRADEVVVRQEHRDQTGRRVPRDVVLRR